MKISRQPWPDLSSGKRPCCGRFPFFSLPAACRDLLFPPHCLACGLALADHTLPLLCAACQSRLVPVTSPLCRCCGTPFTTGRDHLCGACLRRPPSFALARSAFVYQEPLAGLILKLKFRRQLAGLASLAHLACRTDGFATLARPDLVVPVPLHRDRLKKRGYNQALLLARQCFGGSVPVLADVLRKDRATPSQSRLSGAARRRNLSGVFSVAHPELIAGGKILLFDDVFTTGSTTAACSQALCKAGAARVEIFTLARSI